MEIFFIAFRNVKICSKIGKTYMRCRKSNLYDFITAKKYIF